MNAVAEQNPIDRVFKRLAATYGVAWDNAIGQAPIMDVKTTWGHELYGFLRSRESMMPIAWALENLPERCPNVIQFKNLCRQAPATEQPRLPEPKADPERVKAELAKLAPLRQAAVSPSAHDPKAWAKAILRDVQGGLKRNQTVVQMAKQALGQSA
jgi:hypothetical protein